VLEHIVDTVLYLEGDRFHTYRLLRSVKNRFGATSEVGVFEMRGDGMVEVKQVNGRNSLYAWKDKAIAVIFKDGKKVYPAPGS
jgi:predicted ATP-dependent serine protease